MFTADQLRQQWGSTTAPHNAAKPPTHSFLLPRGKRRNPPLLSTGTPSTPSAGKPHPATLQHLSTPSLRPPLPGQLPTTPFTISTNHRPSLTPPSYPSGKPPHRTPSPLFCYPPARPCSGAGPPLANLTRPRPPPPDPYQPPPAPLSSLCARRPPCRHPPGSPLLPSPDHPSSSMLTASLPSTLARCNVVSSSHHPAVGEHPP